MPSPSSLPLRSQISYLRFSCLALLAGTLELFFPLDIGHSLFDIGYSSFLARQCSSVLVRTYLCPSTSSMFSLPLFNPELAATAILSAHLRCPLSIIHCPLGAAFHYSFFTLHFLSPIASSTSFVSSSPVRRTAMSFPSGPISALLRLPPNSPCQPVSNLLALPGT
jgi:hypothetical protein